MKDEPALSLWIEKLRNALAPVREQIPSVRFNNDGWNIVVTLGREEARAIVDAMEDSG